MIYGESLLIHYENFLFALGMGFLIGILNGVYSLIIDVFSIKKIPLYIFDTLYTVFVGVITYLFIFTVNYGIIRLYLFVGEAIGIASYYIGVGPYIAVVWKKYLLKPIFIIKNKIKSKKNKKIS